MDGLLNSGHNVRPSFKVVQELRMHSFGANKIIWNTWLMHSFSSYSYFGILGIHSVDSAPGGRIL